VEKLCRAALAFMLGQGNDGRSPEQIMRERFPSDDDALVLLRAASAKDRRAAWAIRDAVTPTAMTSGSGTHDLVASSAADFVTSLFPRANKARARHDPKHRVREAVHGGRLLRVHARRDQGSRASARCQPHGLRKAAGRRLAEAGCTPHEIMAILGHKTLSEAERYTRDADQARLATAAVARLEGRKVNS
jgi:integrase